eukprot:GILK01001179.1.p2 GENE.GILK01001179.1~~GILK01001179.1.p2  ORF type:complete len:252 (-),score=56.63 GILK01001179.1:1345-2052(-)
MAQRSVLEEVTSQVVKFNVAVNKLKDQVQALGTKRDTSSLRQQLSKERDDARETSRRIAQTLKQAAARIRPDEKAKLEKVTKDFKKVLESYDQVSKDSLRREKELVTIISASLNAENPMMAAVQRDESAQFSEVTFMNAVAMREKEAEIVHLERDVRELNQIFVDLHGLVQQQGEMLDTIESQVEKTKTNVTAANRELLIARKYQNKSRKRMCYILLIAAIVLAVLCGVLIPKFN